MIHPEEYTIRLNSQCLDNNFNLRQSIWLFEMNNKNFLKNQNQIQINYYN